MRAHFDFSGRRRRDSRAEPLERRTLLAVFTVTSALDSGGGTLRDGIEQANAAPGPDTIGFAIGTGAKAIALQSELPAVQDALTIDGATQPGFAGAPLITLNGAAAGASATGLTISAAGSTVRGLVINRFGGDGIVLDGGGASTIAGNYIGTDSAGAAALANGGAGVVIRGGSTGNTIGGMAAADRNIISGNGADGIALSGAGTTGNLI